MKFGQKIIDGFTNFRDCVIGLQKLNKIEGENNIMMALTSSPVYSRRRYIEKCKQDNREILKNYDPVLITYIRKPEPLVFPARKMTDNDILSFYKENFQNTPIGCVTAYKNNNNDICVGYSLCCPKDRFNKVVALNKSLNRMLNTKLDYEYYYGGFYNYLSQEFDDMPHIVREYVERMIKRSEKYFK